MIRILVGFVDESHKNIMHTLVNGCGREGVFDTIYQLCKGAMKLECVVVSDGAKKSETPLQPHMLEPAHYAAMHLLSPPGKGRLQNLLNRRRRWKAPPRPGDRNCFSCPYMSISN